MYLVGMGGSHLVVVMGQYILHFGSSVRRYSHFLRLAQRSTSDHLRTTYDVRTNRRAGRQQTGTAAAHHSRRVLVLSRRRAMCMMEAGMGAVGCCHVYTLSRATYPCTDWLFATYVALSYGYLTYTYSLVFKILITNTVYNNNTTGLGFFLLFLSY